MFDYGFLGWMLTYFGGSLSRTKYIATYAGKLPQFCFFFTPAQCLWSITFRRKDHSAIKPVMDCLGWYTPIHKGCKYCCILAAVGIAMLPLPDMNAVPDLLAFSVSLALAFTFPFFLIHVLWHRFSLMMDFDGIHIFVIEFSEKYAF